MLMMSKRLPGTPTRETNTEETVPVGSVLGEIGTTSHLGQHATSGQHTSGEELLRAHNYNTRRRLRTESPSEELNKSKKRGASFPAREEDEPSLQSKTRKKRDRSNFSQLNKHTQHNAPVNDTGKTPNLHHCVLRESIATRPIDWSLYRDVDAETIHVPDFPFLVNYVNSETSRDSIMRRCVMCGSYRLYANNKAASGNELKADENGIASGYIIPSQNKGICTSCDIAIWVVVNHPNNLEIKWCKGCKNFRPWVAFGEKVLATKCSQCRTRQKLKYKEQKIQKLLPSAGTAIENARTPPKATQKYFRQTAADAFAADVLGNLSRAAMASPSFGSAYVKAVTQKNPSQEKDS